MNATNTTTPAVYAAIVGVMGDLAAEGIGKDRRNDQQGFKFRGIDDVLNALSPILARHRLAMLPRVLSREVTERVTAKGGTLFYVTVAVDYHLVSAVDGTEHIVTTYGEAMDSADKATNKAMSAAYKYAAIQAFCIPTEGDNDADAHSPEPSQRRGGGEAPQRSQPPTRGAAPAPAQTERRPDPEARAAFLHGCGILAHVERAIGRKATAWTDADGDAAKAFVERLAPKVTSPIKDWPTLDDTKRTALVAIARSLADKVASERNGAGSAVDSAAADGVL